MKLLGKCLLVGVIVYISLLITTTPSVIAASNRYPGDLSGKFAETEVFKLDSQSKIDRTFTSDHKVYQSGSQLPPSITFSGTTLTLSDQSGIGIINPAANEPFYKIEVTLVDTNQQNLQGRFTIVDNWWANGITTNGLSMGIDTVKSKSTYDYDHTEFKTQGQIPDSQYNFSQQAKSKFVKRATKDIKLEYYVTPIGVYPVIDGANYASFPDLYIGSNIYHGTAPLNYISIIKRNVGGDPVVFKDLRIVKLDNSVASVDEVNAYFIKKTAESPAFLQIVSDSPSTNGTAGFQNALWAAFLFRGYDYYFGTDHTAQVRSLVDRYLATLPSYINSNLPRYATEPTFNVNHSFINSLSSNTFVVYGISDYLRADQLQTLQTQFARIIDTSEQYIKTDGSFPGGLNQYKGDTFAEEISWLLTFYTGYYATFPTDLPRADKILDYITFFGFIHISDGSTLRSVYGNSVNFKYLPDTYKDFASQYIWPDGSVDNHEFHPSLSYGQGVIGSTAVSKDLLEKMGVVVPTLSHNLDKVYAKIIGDNLNIQTFHLNHTNPRFQDAGRTILNVQEDAYTFVSDGSIVDVYGFTQPSLLEDWTTAFTNYHVLENYGDYLKSTQFAKNVYYGFYTGTGKLFCGHVTLTNGQKCSADTSNVFNYLFRDSLYAMLFSKRSQFSPGSPVSKFDINADGKVDILDLARVVNKRLSDQVSVSPNTPEDLNSDLKVDAVDLQLFLQNHTHL